MRRSRGRPLKADKKVNETLRIDVDVLEAYRQEGKGWQTRINEMLREHAAALAVEVRRVATRRRRFASLAARVVGRDLAADQLDLSRPGVRFSHRPQHELVETARDVRIELLDNVRRRTV